MAIEPLQRQYEAVRYDDVISPLTDPALLGALGRMFGLATAPPAACRVLELGCGQGLNLLAMAARWPLAHFVGVDFVEDGLAQGRVLAEAAGLRNLQLIRADLQDFRWDGQPFDYVIAWGVFSWVPDAVKERLLALTRATLAPQGVACICYLTYPGCKVAEGLRDLMMLRADDPQDGRAGAEAARALLQALQIAGQALAPGRGGAGPWSEAAAGLLGKDPQLLFHDELGGHYDPCYLLQFVAWAGENGLGYLTDADTPFAVDEWLPAAAGTALRAVSDHPLEREQIGDYLSHRTLRVAVLARDVDAAPLALAPSALCGLCLSTTLLALELPGTPAAGPRRFRDPQGGELKVADARIAALLQALCDHPGQWLPFEALLEAGLAQGLPAPTASERDALARALLPLVGRKQLGLSLAAWQPAAQLPDRPRLTPLNEALLRARGLLASGLHRAIRPSAPEARVLTLLDGRLSQAQVQASAAAQALGAAGTAKLLAMMQAEGCLERTAAG